jgi:hypothetical protein
MSFSGFVASFKRATDALKNRRIPKPRLRIIKRAPLRVRGPEQRDLAVCRADIVLWKKAGDDLLIGKRDEINRRDQRRIDVLRIIRFAIVLDSHGEFPVRGCVADFFKIGSAKARLEVNKMPQTIAAERIPP